MITAVARKLQLAQKTPGCLSSLAEYYRLLAVDYDSVLTVPLHCSCEGCTLCITTNLPQLLDAEIVINLFDCLFYYWALIQLRGHIMRRGTDDFYSSLVGMSVGIGPLESGQE